MTIDSVAQLAESLRHLSEKEMQVAAIRRFLEESAQQDPDDMVWQIGQILRFGLRKSTQGAMLLDATSHFFLSTHLSSSLDTFQDRRDQELVRKINRCAYLVGDQLIGLWTDKLGPSKRLPPGSELPNIQLLPLDFKKMPIREPQRPKGEKKTFSTGHRRMIAKTTDRRLIVALLQDRDPLVIRQLLSNRMTRAEDVLVIASRRPTDALILNEVADSRFLRFEAVREALALNPYAFASVALSILPTLGQISRRRVIDAEDLVPEIKTFSSKLDELFQLLS